MPCCGGQGASCEGGSEGRAENHRVVIKESHRTDEPIGQRRGMVAPAPWRRRRVGSSSSYQGVCGRHGGEDRWVTLGELVWFNGTGRVAIVGHPQPKGRGNRDDNCRLEATKRSVWIEARGTCQLTQCQESDQGGLVRNEGKAPTLGSRPGAVASTSRKRGVGRERPWTPLGRRNAETPQIRRGPLESSCCVRPHPNLEDTVTQHDPTSSMTRSGKIPGLVKR
jgi:hypothetical protein